MIDSHSANSLIDDNQDHILNETDDDDDENNINDELIVKSINAANKRRKQNFIVLNENNEEIKNGDENDLDETELIHDNAKRKRTNFYDDEIETINIRKTKTNIDNRTTTNQTEDNNVSLSPTTTTITASTNSIQSNPLKKLKQISSSSSTTDSLGLVTQKILDSQVNSSYANKNNISIYDIKVSNLSLIFF
jgi:hypothetical protein